MSREGKVYVGNLPPDVKQRDLEDLFYKFGKITNINLKNSTQQPFAFLEFDDPRYVCDVLLHSGNSVAVGVRMPLLTSVSRWCNFTEQFNDVN